MTFGIGINSKIFLGNSKSSFPIQDDSRLGAIEYESVKEKLSNNSTDHRHTYNKFKDEDRYAIGKYAAIHGTAAALRKFEKSHPCYRLTESSVRTMHDKYCRIVSSPTAKTITSSKRGRPLMLSSFDEKVKRFLLTLHLKGGAVNIVRAVALAKALITKSSDESLKVMDLHNLSWEKSPFVRGGFVKTTCTTVQPEISEGVCKEGGLIFHHQIVSLVEKYCIAALVVINIDQTLLNMHLSLVEQWLQRTLSMYM